MSEDPYQGDAQFTVSVDGKQIGGTLTTTAITNQGQQQEFDIHGSFGGGSHTVSVAFVNDLINGFYPGTTDAVDTTDRNLYIMGLSLNGGPQAGGAPWEQGENGSHNFTVTAGSNQSAGSAAASAPSSDTAIVTTDSLTSGQTPAGSSSGMSFVAAPATTTTTDTSATTPAASTTPTPTTTDTTASAGSAIAGATQTASDYTIPSTTGSSGTTTTSSSGSSGTHWWMDHQGGNWSGWAAHHQG